MRIYLAGPMTGLPDLNFPAFNAAATKLRGDGHVTMNPAELGLGSDKYRKALTICLAYLCEHAEAIALLPGWQQSKGACAEHATARALGLIVIELS